MAYGDGGFYFLQPVNNGYGALDFTPNPYGAVERGKNFGPYRTYFQPSGVGVAEKTADIQKLKAHLAKLRKFSATVSRNIQKTKSELAVASVFKKRKLKATLTKQELRLQQVRKAVARMQFNLKTAQGRNAVGGAYKKSIQAQFKDPGFTPVEMPSYQVGDENAPDAVKGIWAGEAAFEANLPVSGSFEAIPPEDIISDGPPVVAETFYQQHKNMIMMGAAGARVLGLVMLLRK